MPKRIQTCDEFEAALRLVRVARDRLPEFERPATAVGFGRAFDLWKTLLNLVHGTIAQRDWASTGELLKLYDAVHRVGKTGEMWKSCYVCFLEDVELPADPAELRAFWQICPPVFLREIQRERGMRRRT